MNSIHSIAGLILALYALFVIFTGRVTVSDSDGYGGRSHTSTMISRAEKPLQFWVFVIAVLLVAVVLFFNVFHLPF